MTLRARGAVLSIPAQGRSETIDRRENLVEDHNWSLRQGDEEVKQKNNTKNIYF